MPTDDTDPGQPAPQKPSQWKKIKTTVFVTALPALASVVAIGHELWQWTHGQ